MQIRSKDLDIITAMDEFTRRQGEELAESEMKSYMRHRFEVDNIFRDVNLFDDSKAYLENDRIEWIETAWDSSTNYAVNDRVSFNGKIYIAIQAITNVDPTDDLFWTEIGTNEGIYVAKEDVTAGVLPNVTASWAFGDDRDTQLVAFTIDLALYHLHSAGQVRTNPELRQKRYDDAIKWLKMVQKGEIDLPLEVKLDSDGEEIGETIQGGSEPKLKNDY